MDRRQFIIGVAASAAAGPVVASETAGLACGGWVPPPLHGWSMAVECGGKIVSERTDVPDGFIRFRDDYTFALNFDHPIAAQVTESRSGSVWVLFYHRNWHGGREWVFRLPVEQHFITNGDTVTAST